MESGARSAGARCFGYRCFVGSNRGAPLGFPVHGCNPDGSDANTVGDTRPCSESGAEPKLHCELAYAGISRSGSWLVGNAGARFDATVDDSSVSRSGSWFVGCPGGGSAARIDDCPGAGSESEPVRFPSGDPGSESDTEPRAFRVSAAATERAVQPGGAAVARPFGDAVRASIGAERRLVILGSNPVTASDRWRPGSVPSSGCPSERRRRHRRAETGSWTPLGLAGRCLVPGRRAHRRGRVRCGPAERRG